MLRAAAVAAALTFAAAAGAATTPSVKLAAAMKRSVAASYKGYSFTRVTCSIPSTTATRASCNAYFTLRPQQLKGVFRIAVTIDRSTGGVRWKATSASCTDLRTGAKVKC